MAVHACHIRSSFCHFLCMHITFYVRQTRLTLDVGYSRDIQKHKMKMNTITHWLGCSRRGQQKTRNREAILLPVSSRWRSKPDTAKVNGTYNVKNNHLPHNEPTAFTIFWALVDLIHTSTTPNEKYVRKPVLKMLKIALRGGWMFFPLTVAVSGLERHQGETGSSIASRFHVFCCLRLEQPSQCAIMFIFPCLYVFEYPSNIQSPT